MGAGVCFKDSEVTLVEEGKGHGDRRLAIGAGYVLIVLQHAFHFQIEHNQEISNALHI
jgi:hypothetical protein